MEFKDMRRRVSAHLNTERFSELRKVYSVRTWMWMIILLTARKKDCNEIQQSKCIEVLENKGLHARNMHVIGSLSGIEKCSGS